MSTLTCVETFIDNDQSNYGSFIIEPLEIGHGITLGNALRRTLLSNLTGYSISGIRINDLKHEFASVEGLREDILEIILNLKEIVFKASSKDIANNSMCKGYLNIKGPVIVTAGMFKLPKNFIKILNPNQYICTITDTSEFYLEIDIEKGKGYRLSDETRKKKVREKVFQSKPSTILVDALFMPVKKVNYKIKLIHDTRGNIKESLMLEVYTNGSMSPKRSIQESIKILMNLFYSLFMTPHFLKISSELTKNKT